MGSGCSFPNFLTFNYMSSTLNFSPNTYAGQAAGGYLSKALLGAKTLQQNLITILPNIKKRLVLRTVEQDVIFQNAGADFSTAGNTQLGERYLDPVEMSVMYELKYPELVQSWEAARLRAGAHASVPDDLAAFLIMTMEEKIAIGTEKLLWMGKASSSDFAFSAAYPGLIALMEASASTRKQAATTGQLNVDGISVGAAGIITVADTSTLNTGDKVTFIDCDPVSLANGVALNGKTFTITVIDDTTFSIGTAITGSNSSGGWVQFINRSNVVEVLTAIYNNTPEAVKHKADFRLFVPLHVADAYRLRQAEVAQGSGTYFTTDKALNFLGKQMEEMPWFAPNTIVAARSSNLYFGTDLLADYNNIQVVDMRQSTADHKVRFRATFASDVNFGYGEEILLYRPAEV